MPRTPSISRAEAAKRRSKLMPITKAPAEIVAKTGPAKKTVKKKPSPKR